MSLYFSILEAFKQKGSVDDHAYHPQFRIEARARDADNDDSLAMRLADPLWNLGRQWQFGEFKGEDNGSPISAFMAYNHRKTTTFSTNNTPQPISLDNAPLEAMVEAMATLPDDLHAQVKYSQQFLRLVARTGNPSNIAAIVERLKELFPLDAGAQPDAKSQRFARLMSNKAFNGARVLRLIIKDEFLAADPVFAALLIPAQELVNWFRDQYVQPYQPAAPAPVTSAWEKEKLVHQFRVHTDGPTPIILQAPDYQDGHLDWYSFDGATALTLPGEAPTRTSPQLPINLAFPGMPKKRLFSFEDNRVVLGDMDINDDDLIRIMLIDFSLHSGSDWFILPLTMASGDLAWVRQVTVKDVFGVQTVIENKEGIGPSLSHDQDGDGRLTGLDVWDVFKIRDQLVGEYDSKDHFLYLTPTITGRQESEPLEEVLFLRDEFANMVWGIEKRLRNGIGEAVDGFDYHLEQQGPFIPLEAADAEDPDNYAKYRLAGKVPFNWIPYLPYLPKKTGDAAVLRRGYMVKQDGSDILPLGYLTKDDLARVRLEAIPKAGLRVQITRQRVRTADGKTHLWLGRKVLAGRGEGDSGLQFDYLE